MVKLDDIGGEQQFFNNLYVKNVTLHKHIYIIRYCVVFENFNF